MKYVAVLLALAAFVYGYEEVVHLEPLGNYGGQSTTTRYWDCCKPTCAWIGHTTGKKHPVKACGKDGVTVVDGNIQSGCENDGTSYICNNQVPWAVNSSFAYGFIAAAFKNPPENMCCACLLLKFQKGGYGADLTGKEMVVQVTNTGAGSANTSREFNAFDLQIPGGGVGYYTEGCRHQWNAPSKGWGDQYGGCETKDCCNKLPTQLRKGCLFRWEWMEGASNPPVTFQQVTCPAALTAVTGCA